MITRKLNIDIYDWKIHYTEVEKGDTSEVINSHLKKLFPKKERKKEAALFVEFKDNIDNNRKDGGICVHFGEYRKTCILIYRMRNKREMKRVLAHEFRHLADFIIRYYDINDNEAAAFLQGYIFMKLYKI